MTKRLMRFAAAVLAAALCLPTAWAVEDSGKDMKIRVGLASSSEHNKQGELACAHLENNTGYGAGFRFGYYDDELEFVELAATGEDVTQVAVLKTQNMYYGYDAEAGKYTYSDSNITDKAVGCYHIQLPGSYAAYRDAAEDAEIYGGFVAWINGAYQVRVGAYLSRDGAEGALATMNQGTIVGTSAYGLNVVETGTGRILFQYDGGEGSALAVLPDVTGAEDVRTWFLGYKYRGGFTYGRVTGGNITVVNVLDLEDYVKGVVCYEMGREWPLEALKAQAVCARTYALQRLNYHGARGFDVCNTSYCQVYYGVGTKRTDYGPTAVSNQAVEETAGRVLWYKDKLADTYYSSSHGGASESAYNIWGTSMEKYPYLCGVTDPYEQTINDRNPYSPWTVRYTAKELAQRLQSFGHGVGSAIDHLELTYSELGNVLKVVVHWTNGQTKTYKSNGKSSAKTDIISTFGLRSIRFTVNGQTVQPGVAVPDPEAGFTVNGSDTLSSLEGLYAISGDGAVSEVGEDLYVIAGDGKTAELQPADSGEIEEGTNEGGGTVVVSGDSYVFEGGGWSHQIGMSQYGANAMARLGFAYDEIVEFYFPGTNVDLY